MIALDHIDESFLERLGACRLGMDNFRYFFGDRAEITPENWSLARFLLPQSQIQWFLDRIDPFDEAGGSFESVKKAIEAYHA